MQTSRDSTASTLAKNLKHLMNRAGHNSRMLAELTKGEVSQRTIVNIVKQEKVAKIDTVARIASVYGLQGWHLISPTLIDDLKRSPTISKLVADYQSASPSGKALIEQIAEREAEYAAKNEPR